MDERVGIIFAVFVESLLTTEANLVRVFANEKSAVDYANMKNEAVGDKRYNYYPRSYGVFA